MKLQSHWSDDVIDIFRDDQLCNRAMRLFYTTGHTIYREPRTLDRDIRNFIYIDIKHKHVFTPDELSILDCVKSASFLFTNGTEYFGDTDVDQAIDYFAVSLETADIDRSQIAYEVHHVFSLFSPSVLSIILFEVNSKYMFSLASRRKKQRSKVTISDWYSVQEMLDNSLICSLDVAYISDKNANEFFHDFVYNIVRAPSVSCNQDDFILDNHKKNAAPILNTDDLGLELFELEISATRNESITENYPQDDSNADEYDLEEEQDISVDMDDELFKDPTKLLKWIEDSEAL